MIKLTAVKVLRFIEQNPRVTPLEISHKLKISAQYVRNIVRMLTELGLVDTPVRGVYVITDLGKYILNKQTKKEESSFKGTTELERSKYGTS